VIYSNNRPCWRKLSMRILWLTLPAALVMGTALAGCGTTSTTRAPVGTVGCSTQGETAKAATKSYRIVLDVRPVSTMFAPGQVPAGTKSGDVMYAGSMTSASGPEARNVDIHICSVSDDRVLTNLKPVITLQDMTSGTVQTVPYATMQGVGQGAADFHYGNTMIVKPGDAYMLTVSVDGQSARLDFTEPKASTAGAGTSTTMGNMKMSTITTAKASATTATSSLGRTG
jgi:hypothetical protein